jgi:CRISPR-associated protein Csm5
MATYRLDIETVSPVHIGSGRPELRRNLDFAVFGQTLYMLNSDAVLDRILPTDEDHPQFQKILNASSLAGFIDAELLESDPSLYLYKLQGKSALESVRAATKNAYGQAYIPGSSLKGALRSAWVRQVYQQRGLVLDVDRMNDRREWAFQDLESDLLSPQARRPAQRPNYDLFRALQIADSQPAPEDSLRLYNAVVFPAGPRGIPIDLEGIKPRVAIQSRLKVDEYILHTRAEEFGVAAQQFSFENLVQAWREQGMQRIAQELAFWERRSGGERLLEFFSGLEKQASAAEANTFFIEVGWGAGWKSKTLGNLISGPTLARVMSRYRLTRNPYREGDAFPKTRRAARDAQDVLRVPFGWLKVTIG